MALSRLYNASKIQNGNQHAIVMQSMAETMRVVRQAMKCDTKQLLKFDSDDFIDDAIYMDQQEQQAELAGPTNISGP